MNANGSKTTEQLHIDMSNAFISQIKKLMAHYPPDVRKVIFVDEGGHVIPQFRAPAAPAEEFQPFGAPAAPAEEFQPYGTRELWRNVLLAMFVPAGDITLIKGQTPHEKVPTYAQARIDAYVDWLFPKKKNDDSGGDGNIDDELSRRRREQLFNVLKKTLTKSRFFYKKRLGEAFEAHYIQVQTIIEELRNKSSVDGNVQNARARLIEALEIYRVGMLAALIYGDDELLHVMADHGWNLIHERFPELDCPEGYDKLANEIDWKNRNIFERFFEAIVPSKKNIKKWIENIPGFLLQLAILGLIFWGTLVLLPTIGLVGAVGTVATALATTIVAAVCIEVCKRKFTDHFIESPTSRDSQEETKDAVDSMDRVAETLGMPRYNEYHPGRTISFDRQREAARDVFKRLDGRRVVRV
jgi:hypothetical protein